MYVCACLDTTATFEKQNDKEKKQDKQEQNKEKIRREISSVNLISLQLSGLPTKTFSRDVSWISGSAWHWHSRVALSQRREKGWKE